jgi:hypothetical protein
MTMNCAIYIDDQWQKPANDKYMEITKPLPAGWWPIIEVVS